MPNTRTFEFLPLTVRIETLGGIATPLVLRGTPLPATRSETFSTAADGQTSVEVKLLLGESSISRHNLSLGTFHLNGIPPSKKGEPSVVVEFAVAANCTITARALLKGTETQAIRNFQPPHELSDLYVKELLAQAESTRAEDEAELSNVELRNRAIKSIEEAEGGVAHPLSLISLNRPTLGVPYPRDVRGWEKRMSLSHPTVFVLVQKLMTFPRLQFKI